MRPFLLHAPRRGFSSSLMRKNALPNYYEVMGLSPTATASQIKDRFYEVNRNSMKIFYYPVVLYSEQSANLPSRISLAVQKISPGHYRRRFSNRKLPSTKRGIRHTWKATREVCSSHPSTFVRLALSLDMLLSTIKPECLSDYTLTSIYRRKYDQGGPASARPKTPEEIRRANARREARADTKSYQNGTLEYGFSPRSSWPLEFQKFFDDYVKEMKEKGFDITKTSVSGASMSMIAFFDKR